MGNEVTWKSLYLNLDHNPRVWPLSFRSSGTRINQGWEKADILYCCLNLGKNVKTGSEAIPNAALVTTPVRDLSVGLSLQPTFQAFHRPHFSPHPAPSWPGEPRGICDQVGQAWSIQSALQRDPLGALRKNRTIPTGIQFTKEGRLPCPLCSPALREEDWLSLAEGPSAGVCQGQG